MSKIYKIAVIPGDGTGPEVIGEGLKVLNAISMRLGIKYDFTNYDFGGTRYLRTGEVLPKGAIDELRKFDAIYLGAIGHPEVKPGILEKGILLRLRFELDQYINLRPVKLYPGVECPLKNKSPEDIDFVVVRENTEGLYAGAGGGIKKKEHLMRLQFKNQSIQEKVLKDVSDLLLNIVKNGIKVKNSPYVERQMFLHSLLICGKELFTRLQKNILILK